LAAAVVRVAVHITGSSLGAGLDGESIRPPPAAVDHPGHQV